MGDFEILHRQLVSSIRRDCESVAPVIASPPTKNEQLTKTFLADEAISSSRKGNKAQQLEKDYHTQNLGTSSKILSSQ
jgi:hypothetical protein